MKKFVIWSALIFIGIGVLSYFKYQKSLVGSTYSVILTNDGFSPQELTIQKGDTIIFTATNNQQFWPASDLHPTHGIFPEFDPRQPVEPGQSWSFKFKKEGTWKYHDHLFSSYRGVIIVEDNKNKNENYSLNDCAENGNKFQCWEDNINSTLEGEGLNAAFELLANLYTNEPEFARSCHDYAHKLGKSAYDKFIKKEDIDITSKTSYCGYGFYHGFMETLLQSEGNAGRAKDFCLYVGNKLADETSDAEGACYHGIGHGAVDGGDPRAWGDPQAMIDPAIKTCESFSSGHYLYRCVTGAYNALEILSADLKYKLDVINKDPFWLCPSQPLAYREGCYTNMLPALMRFTNNDYPRMFSIIEKISDPSETYDSRYSVREIVVLGLAHELLKTSWTDPDYIPKTVSQCRNLKSRLACIEGLSGGHMKYGEPEREYVKGLSFCDSSLLKEDEKNVCYQHILSRLRIWYSQEKTKEICQDSPTEHRRFCLDF
ncbi:MAG: hypothetical protein A3B86_03940 [Candidatus Yanofskybacteria bacterium RIFCSPHIGHO2_02_FULL_38_22b]|uniref:EfeO-type cupredoxin-like domain-containing protein n=1 Tax=Candidatus Yanofskybacteria bacterium RIFCSPHIGHO2_02_FULL_38_22b TaxID=1802673 RepID=A0A1F8EZE5_9BACT|nr:MAG: hypothetical protein A2816_01710 [Candidatus Yanofskybacteria bacterium RIFCSPHIGHO2_01_FULL_39_44]OGN06242.1 MAG: hypothetical protein A3B86_03940 [Candidatus Yanofskybacteria bacterium RIFCSPHIGHO2_02_FULL_38_22b]OGN19662.1 MAG: hypothetical protein A2910_03675 [Candidatus Yanofskybacteria bacterium RIFCSPLOWO2_01_FULL_39_28]